MASSKGIKYLNIVNGSIQTKTYSFAAFTILVILILLIGAIRPTMLTISRINKELREKKLINEQLDNKINALASLGNQYSDIRQEVDALPLIFPTQGNFSLFMSNIDEITRSNGYNLIGITFSKPDEFNMKLKVLKPWSARITVSGTKANLINLLEDIEAMPMYPVVDQVSFTSKSDSKGQTTISIEAVIFRIDDPNFYK